MRVLVPEPEEGAGATEHNEYGGEDGVLNELQHVRGDQHQYRG